LLASERSVHDTLIGQKDSTNGDLAES